MRILVVHNRYRSAAPSGENQVVDRESAALRALGHTVRYFERHSDDIEQWSRARQAMVATDVVWSPSSRRSMAATLAEFKPDIVHIHNTFPLISPSILTACVDAGVPVVATLHNYKLLCAAGEFFRSGRVCHECDHGSLTPALKHGCYRGSAVSTLPIVTSMRVHRHTWQTAVSAYICVSDAQRQLLAGVNLPPERVFVKWNLVENRALPVTTKEHLLTYLGRLDTAKGVPMLMAAWDSFCADYPQTALRLQVVGSGPLDNDVTTWAKSHGNVDFVGQVPPGEVQQLLAKSLAVMLPSQWEETFGLVAIEAMAAGTAPVATAHGAFPELISSGVDGILFPPGQVSALAQAMHHVDRDPELFAVIGAAARRKYEESFDPGRTMDELLDIYRFAIDRNVSATRAKVPARG